MNLKELDSFKISDAVTFHDKLNPALWAGNKLRPEVKNQLEEIAKDFLEEMGINDLDVRDITISGSNAAYSYTKHSDLDLHLLVNINDLPNNDIYREFFDAKKSLYNDNHDITIHGVPVELYIQDAAQPSVSLGEYSLQNDKWLRIPTKRRANFDQSATRLKYEKLLDIVERALDSKNLTKIQKVLKKIKQYRQAGLDKGGEFGPENLAYKALRSQGYITKLHDLKNKLHSEVLTIETMYQNIDETFDQPYKLKWEKSDYGDVDAYAKMDDGNYLSIMFNKGYNQDKEEAWSVEFYRNNSQEVTGEGDAQRVFATVLSAIQTFIKKYKPNKVIFSASKEVEDGQNSESRARLYDSLVQRYARAWGFRAFRADTGNKVIYELSRKQPVDEDISRRGFLKGMGAAAVTGSAKAGQYQSSTEISPEQMQQIWKPRKGELETRCYAILKSFANSIAESHPDWVKVIQKIKVNTTLGDKVFRQGNAANSRVSSRVVNGKPIGVQAGQIGIETTVFWDAPNDTLAFILGHECGHIIMNHGFSLASDARNNEQEADIIGASLAKKIGYDRANFFNFLFNAKAEQLKNGSPNDPHLEPVDRVKFLKKNADFELSHNTIQYIDSLAQQLKQGLAEASGYIPSEKEKNDPRFKTALTVDVGPYSIKKNAKAFSWLTSRAGIPPTASPNGKV